MKKSIAGALAAAALPAAFLVAASVQTPAQAWVNDNCKRPNASISYKISGSYAAASGNAVAAWDATSTPLSFNTATPTEVYISSTNAGTSFDGITSRKCGSGVQTEPAYSYYNTFYASGYSATARKSLMVHEIGHALGLGHAGANGCQMPIMYKSSDRYFSCGYSLPRPDDIVGINVIY